MNEVTLGSCVQLKMLNFHDVVLKREENNNGNDRSEKWFIFQEYTKKISSNLKQKKHQGYWDEKEREIGEEFAEPASFIQKYFQEHKKVF